MTSYIFHIKIKKTHLNSIWAKFQEIREPIFRQKNPKKWNPKLSKYKKKFYMNINCANFLNQKTLYYPQNPQFFELKWIFFCFSKIKWKFFQIQKNISDQLDITKKIKEPFWRGRSVVTTRNACVNSVVVRCTLLGVQ